MSTCWLFGIIIFHINNISSVAFQKNCSNVIVEAFPFSVADTNNIKHECKKSQSCQEETKPLA